MMFDSTALYVATQAALAHVVLPDGSIKDLNETESRAHVY
jgi:hypothetical protein